jgi:hypothetical protein
MTSQENKHVTQKEHDADHTTSCTTTVFLPVVHKVLFLNFAFTFSLFFFFSLMFFLGFKI